MLILLIWLRYWKSQEMTGWVSCSFASFVLRRKRYSNKYLAEENSQFSELVCVQWRFIIPDVANIAFCWTCLSFIDGTMYNRF